MDMWEDVLVEDMRALIAALLDPLAIKMLALTSRANYRRYAQRAKATPMAEALGGYAPAAFFSKHVHLVLGDIDLSKEPRTVCYDAALRHSQVVNAETLFRKYGMAPCVGQVRHAARTANIAVLSYLAQRMRFDTWLILRDLIDSGQVAALDWLDANAEAIRLVPRAYDTFGLRYACIRRNTVAAHWFLDRNAPSGMFRLDPETETWLQDLLETRIDGTEQARRLGLLARDPRQLLCNAR